MYDKLVEEFEADIKLIKEDLFENEEILPTAQIIQEMRVLYFRFAEVVFKSRKSPVSAIFGIGVGESSNELELVIHSIDTERRLCVFISTESKKARIMKIDANYIYPLEKERLEPISASDIYRLGNWVIGL